MINRAASTNIGEHIISNSYWEKLLSIKIDSQLNFNNHLQTIIKKASQKVHVLARITPYMCISKRKLFMNAFFELSFSYCPLVWMYHSRSMNNKINRLHERYLRIIYNNKTSSFLDLLAKTVSVTYTQEIDKFLPLKCLRYNKNMSTELMQGLFCVRQTHYNLRNPHNFAVLSINFVYHGSESISNLGPRIWNLIPHRLK